MQSLRIQRSIRRIFMGGAFAVTLAAGVVLGTLLTSDQAAAQQDLMFGGGAAIMLHWVKSDAAAEYEGVMQQLREALRRSENTEVDRQAQARGWKVYRAADDLTGRGAMYVWVIDPVLGGENYAAMSIISEVLTDSAEQQRLYESYSGAYQDSSSGPVNWRTTLTPVAGF